MSPLFVPPPAGRKEGPPHLQFERRKSLPPSIDRSIDPLHSISVIRRRPPLCMLMLSECRSRWHRGGGFAREEGERRERRERRRGSLRYLSSTFHRSLPHIESTLWRRRRWRRRRQTKSGMRATIHFPSKQPLDDWRNWEPPRSQLSPI